MKTDNPLLVSVDEASFHFDSSPEDIDALIKAGEIDVVIVCGRKLILYESLLKFIRRARRKSRSVTEKASTKGPT